VCGVHEEFVHMLTVCNVIYRSLQCVMREQEVFFLLKEGNARARRCIVQDIEIYSV
jgi:hypothetical protein